MNVSTDRSPDADEAYDENYQEPYEDDDAGFWFPSATFGWWPPTFYGRDVDEEYGQAYDEDVDDQADGTWLDEGLISLLLVVGVALFLFPEPATSGLGIVLVATGALLWLIDWAT